MTNQPGDLVKVMLSGPDGEVETPWAEQVGEHLFRLDNMPFYAYGVSVDDIIEADPTEHEGVFPFVRVHESSATEQSVWSSRTGGALLTLTLGRFWRRFWRREAPTRAQHRSTSL